MTGKSLIQIEGIPCSDPPNTDWIFFSSPNGVKYFFQQQVVSKAVQYGTIGPGTAKALRTQGIEAAFIGDNARTEAIGKTFAKRVVGKSVLFPGASSGLRTVQQQLTPETQAFDVPVYQVVETPLASNPTADFIVLTSPSNVRAFCQTALPTSAQQVIAIGQATARALQEQGVSGVLVAERPTEVAMAQLVLQQL